MIEVGLTVTSSIRHNVHVTGRCTLRVVVLTEKPSYSKAPYSIPCKIPDTNGGMLVTTSIY